MYIIVERPACGFSNIYIMGITHTDSIIKTSHQMSDTSSCHVLHQIVDL